MIVQNPVIWADFPDPEVIRVEDTYYMASTTMHFMPGAVLLRSFDLANWEIVAHAYDALEDYPAARLENGLNIYGAGMWAPSLRFHNGKFYLLHVANDTHKTYLHVADRIEGPWTRQYVEGFYHDPSILFDDDGRVYVAHGNTSIFVTELNRDLTGPQPGGLNKLIVKDKENNGLGYEGSHIQKINGKYYVFFIHWPKGGRRSEACFMSDRLDGEWVGKDVLDDDMGYFNNGVAQGGIVDTPDGDWYAILFQDRGGAGRMPVLVPVTWKDGFPEFGERGAVPKRLEVRSTRPDYVYQALYGSDDFRYAPGPDGSVRLKPFWEWNHIPKADLWSVTERPGWLRLKTDARSVNVVQARNTLTQRLFGPRCAVSVTVDGSRLADGDFAGLAAFQSGYGFIALTKRDGRLCITVAEKPYGSDGPKSTRQDDLPAKILAEVPCSGQVAELRMRADFENLADTIAFDYRIGSEWVSLGPVHRARFMLDHFVGCRAALFYYSTERPGGFAQFSALTYSRFE